MMGVGRSPSLSTRQDSRLLPPHVLFTVEIPKMQEGPLKPHSKPSWVLASAQPYGFTARNHDWCPPRNHVTTLKASASHPSPELPGAVLAGLSAPEAADGSWAPKSSCWLSPPPAHLAFALCRHL